MARAAAIPAILAALGSLIAFLGAPAAGAADEVK